MSAVHGQLPTIVTTRLRFAVRLLQMPDQSFIPIETRRAVRRRRGLWMAQAKTLTGRVPEVDRLSIRIVTDIIVRRYATSQKLHGLTVERMQGDETPDAPPHATLVGEWGLSMHAACLNPSGSGKVFTCSMRAPRESQGSADRKTCAAGGPRCRR
jgi:hypothetical protein